MKLRITLILAAVAVVPTVGILAEDPDWWTDVTYGIFDPAPAVGENYMTVNVGQLKFVSTQAKAFLDIRYGLSASDWDEAFGGAANNPFPFATGSDPDNFAPANIGQLKFIALGFYRVLDQVGYPVDWSLKFQGLENTDITEYQGTVVPWTSAVLREENYAPVNVGQLKLVFSFDINPDRSVGFDLGGVEPESFYSRDDTPGDEDHDLFAAETEQLMGLDQTATFHDVAGLSAMIDSSLQQSIDAHATAHCQSEGPVLLIQGEGYFAVNRSDLTLENL